MTNGFTACQLSEVLKRISRRGGLGDHRDAAHHEGDDRQARALLESL